MKSAQQIRDSFRDFFAERGHERVESSSLVPQGDPTLMFVNAGMVQFKDLFTGEESRAYKRATTAQKCMRVSGKHNDLENVGVTARHHTFFEMLGNFSFGDYFKEEAIVYAWDYLTRVLQIDQSRLLVSVFGGEGELSPDEEAARLWRKVSGLSEERIVRMGAADNFWQMGDTGPCGPCTEIHYFFGEGEPDVRRFGDEPDEAGSGWVELWNLVFMQFERFAGGRMEPLPAPSIDTGMGLERLACVIQGVVSNYDTDLLRPIVELASQISGKPYGATQSPSDVSMRVVADHARAAAFLIADGVFPDRDARPYVLRRVMRRAIRHGHSLGIDRLFLHECALRVVDLMGDEYSELRERRALIEDIVRQEEERFRATLKRGLERLGEIDLGREATLPGEVAFELYDTYGFPLDLQEVIGREQGFSVDAEGFQRSLEQARARSRRVEFSGTGTNRTAGLGELTTKVTFIGYETECGEAKVAELLHDGKRVARLASGQEGAVVVHETPFYGEAGGQVGDRGAITGQGMRFEVRDTLKPRDGLFLHVGVVKQGELTEGMPVTLQVDSERRAATRRNHSATHLLHLALRKVVGPQAMQKGSLVGPDRLRFDYSGAQPLSREQIREIEDIVNERILLNAPVTTDVLSMDEAKERGAIGIFEEKYGDVVRMLTIADSIELCGGTHVARTGDIGVFKIVSEAGIAAGVRRIEAATGRNALLHVRVLEDELDKTAELVKGGSGEVAAKVQRLIERSKDLTRENERLKRQIALGGVAAGEAGQDAGAGGASGMGRVEQIADGTRVQGNVVAIGDSKLLRELADQQRDKLAPAVIALGSQTEDGKALLVCTVSKELTKRYHAGKLIKRMAELVGGGGGGRPDFAQAGGSDPKRLQEAVERVYELVRGG